MKDSAQSNLAADALRLTAGDLKKFGLIDEVISEPKSWEINPEDSSDKKKARAYNDIAENSFKSMPVQVDNVNSRSAKN